MTRVSFMIAIFAVVLASGCGGDATQGGHQGKTTDATWAETLDAPYAAEDPCGYACNLGAYQCYATNTVQRCELVHGCAQWKLLKTCDMGYVCVEGNCLFSTPCPNGTCDDGETACTCPDDCGHPPQGEWICADNIDNDCNGATDCDDPDCEGVWPCETTTEDSCKGVKCDDGEVCTEDLCAGGECFYYPYPLDDCCKTNADCKDSDLCTNDACVDHQCVYTPKDCEDGDPCTKNGCNTNGVCTKQPIPGCGAMCGNGKIETGEQCDDGNKVDDDCCTADCTVEPSGSQPCGVGECKIAVAKCNADGTQKTCTPKAKPQATETTCNDAKDNDCDGKTDCGDTNCSANPACAEPAVCGNGKCELGAEDMCSCPDDCPNDPQVCEACECGGSGGDECYCDNVCPDYGDCCADACEVCGECAPSCGNNVCATDGSENCPACPDDCGPCAPGAACGNGKIELPEQCDDGNQVNGDCCSASCAVENLGDLPCGTGLCSNSVPNCKSDGKPNTSCTPKPKPEATEVTCTDGKDNDCDGKSDCGDTNCSASPACAEPDPDSCVGKCGENAGNCWCDATCLTALDCCADACTTCGQCAVCGNGKCEFGEDDCIPCDTDCPGCASPVENCTNGLDDDNDGKKDCADADCKDKSCNDGKLCTKADSCTNGLCGGIAYSCNDDIACTADTCDGAGNCVYPVDIGYCLIAGACFFEGQKGGICKVCNPWKNQNGWTFQDGSNCEDGDLCTSGSKCLNGECVGGTFLACPPGEICDKGKCIQSGAVCGKNGCEAGETCANCPSDCPCSLGKTCYNNTCCTPKTCAQLPSQCGNLSNGCGGTVTCSCPLGQTCDSNGACQTTTCTGCNSCQKCDPATGKCVTDASKVGVCCKTASLKDMVCSNNGSCDTSAPSEKCNGVDDDCDGTNADETTLTQSCNPDGCGTGTQSCVDGQWGSCTTKKESCQDFADCQWKPMCPPCPAKPSEKCNGKDDNCDGATDEGFAWNGISLGNPCDGSDGDTCEDGTVVCKSDGSDAICNDNSTSATEGDSLTCSDGKDNNCDQATDCEDSGCFGKQCADGYCIGNTWYKPKTCSNATCSSAGSQACDDNNPCTSNSCTGSGCTYSKLANGSDCGDGNTCSNGNCACALTVVDLYDPNEKDDCGSVCCAWACKLPFCTWITIPPCSKVCDYGCNGVFKSYSENDNASDFDQKITATLTKNDSEDYYALLVQNSFLGNLDVEVFVQGATKDQDIEVCAAWLKGSTFPYDQKITSGLKGFIDQDCTEEGGEVKNGWCCMLASAMYDGAFFDKWIQFQDLSYQDDFGLIIVRLKYLSMICDQISYTLNIDY